LVGSLASASQNRSDRSKIEAEELKDLVRKSVGSKVGAAVGLIGEPTYILGDFNGDGNSDIAIIVVIEKGSDDLQQNGVRYIDIDPYSRTNGQSMEPASGSAMFQNCLGVTFLHGSTRDWDSNTISEKFIVYDCFSSFRRIPKGQRIRRGSGSTGPTPKPRGDSILLDLETGGTSLVYWNGKTYRGFGIRGGD
jgi:hypothetical protein